MNDRGLELISDGGENTWQYGAISHRYGEYYRVALGGSVLAVGAFPAGDLPLDLEATDGQPGYHGRDHHCAPQHGIEQKKPPHIGGPGQHEQDDGDEDQSYPPRLYHRARRTLQGDGDCFQDLGDDLRRCHV